MPPKFGANLGPNEGTTDSGADTFDASGGATQDNTVASNNISTPSSVVTPANTSTDVSNTTTDQPVSEMNTQNPFANKVIASGPDSHPAHTQASGSGDIILHNSQPKDNKKIFIVAGIIGLIIVAFVITISLLLGFSKKSSGVATAEEQFNQYANYVLYGETGTTLEGEYDEYKSYKLSQEFYADDYDEQFWQTAGEMLDKAVQASSNSEGEERGLVDFLQNYQQNFKFLSGYLQVVTNEPTDEQIMAIYFSSGAEAARKVVSDFYSALPDTESINSNEYVELKQKQYDSTISVLDLYKQYGCIDSDNNIAEYCEALANGGIEKVVQLQEAITQNREEATDALNNILDGLISGCWTISEWYSRPSDEELYNEFNTEGEE